MAEARIPVDLFNPGQVFACLGLMEVADILLGEVIGAFDWSESRPYFSIRAGGKECPVRCVVQFLIGSSVQQIVPRRWAQCREICEAAKRDKKLEKKCNKLKEIYSESCKSDYCNSNAPRDTSLAFLLENGDTEIVLDNWSDETGRKPLKLYAGNRSAAKIARDMICAKGAGVVALQKSYDKQNKLREFWHDPFGVLAPLGGTFNLDSRRSWSAIDTGYSPDQQDQKVLGSPLVELLAVIGLQNARPIITSSGNGREIIYSVWEDEIPLVFCRSAVACDPIFSRRRFRSRMVMSGRNKILSFAKEEL